MNKWSFALWALPAVPTLIKHVWEGVHDLNIEDKSMLASLYEYFLKSSFFFVVLVLHLDGL